MERKGRASQPHNTRVPRSGEPNTDGAQRGLKRSADQYMPMASIMRIAQRMLPNKGTISDDAKEVVQECVTEFISFITAEANERCRRDSRCTITANDIISAMAALGFQDYVEPLSLFIHKHRALNSAAPHTTRHQLPIDQMVVFPPSPPPTVDGYFPSPPQNRGDYFQLPEIINYNSMGDFGGGGQGSSNDMEFDPFS